VDGLAGSLARLGLTGYEARAYLALTRRGVATGAELARLAGLPRQRIYDVLEALVARGFATIRAGRPLRYSAVAPAEALERLLEDRRRELGEAERLAAEAADRLTATYEAGRDHTDPLGFVEVLREAGAIASRFAELQAAAESEILVFTKPPYATPPAENVEGLKLLERGSARSVYERSILEHPDALAAVERFIRAGEQARVVDELPMKLAIIDERIAMFSLKDPVAGGDELTILVVEHPALAALLKIAFEAVWEAGQELPESAAAPARARPSG
jgi:HTH-type transcriptional regulator, sugar sensing transcriptional regulator